MISLLCAVGVLASCKDDLQTNVSCSWHEVMKSSSAGPRVDQKVSPSSDRGFSRYSPGCITNGQRPRGTERELKRNWKSNGIESCKDFKLGSSRSRPSNTPQKPYALSWTSYAPPMCRQMTSCWSSQGQCPTWIGTWHATQVLLPNTKQLPKTKTMAKMHCLHIGRIAAVFVALAHWFSNACFPTHVKAYHKRVLLESLDEQLDAAALNKCWCQDLNKCWCQDLKRDLALQALIKHQLRQCRHHCHCLAQCITPKQ